MKKRQAPDFKAGGKSSPAGFMELAVPVFNPDAHPPGFAGLELTHPSGSKLTLRSPGARVRDFLPVIEAFLGS